MEELKELISIKENIESRIKFLDSYMDRNYYCGVISKKVKKYIHLNIRLLAKNVYK